MNGTGLKRFAEANCDFSTVKRVLGNDRIKTVKMFCLGPDGTNISKAARQWVKEIGIQDKAVFIYCDTPEEEVRKAREVTGSGDFPVIVLCAVYCRLNDLYFSHEDCYFFMHHYYMPLDDLQLAAREGVERIPEDWVIAAHPSPKPLLSGLKNRIYEANSNAHAAKLCAEGKVNACITTEKARKIYSLKKIHDFGSPMMLFTFGTTLHGINILKRSGA
ncbi:MAG: hypothetical protein QHH10_02780 [Peptococcaceae bacterium]|jgi:hypothetical protein|nr:hypothetical protein [Peptococcaceae bacterium]MDH7524219.1 hypothetical protein [Peptococcaceae bacterium]